MNTSSIVSTLKRLPHPAAHMLTAFPILACLALFSACSNPGLQKQNGELPFPTAASRGEGTWNEERVTENVVGSAQIAYSFRLHMCRVLSADELKKFRGYLNPKDDSGNPKTPAQLQNDRDLLRTAIKSILDVTNAKQNAIDAIAAVGDDFADDGKTAWKIRAFHDYNGAKDFLEVSLVGSLASETELTDVEKYLSDNTYQAGKLALQRAFNGDRAAAALLGL